MFYKRDLPFDENREQDSLRIPLDVEVNRSLMENSRPDTPHARKIAPPRQIGSRNTQVINKPGKRRRTPGITQLRT